MSNQIQVEAARIPDRERLLQALRDAGLDAKPSNDVGIEIVCGDDTNAACDELHSYVEGIVMDLGAPFVPIKHEGVIYVRPPVS
jgi:hypothetical protein